MIFRRFYDEKLAQASYLVGCGVTGEALVVDAARDVDAYVRAAEQEGLQITHITETHIHADFVSGSRELAERTGARLHLSDEGDASWKYAYASASDAVLLKDGNSFMVGNIRIEVMHTPGHTPEHLVFVVTDTAAADRPMGVLTGDLLFVGDVGRPDLLEKAAGVTGTMEPGARALFHSLQRIKRGLPDFVQIWPGHGAGSACGKSLGAVPQSTLGYERLFNWGLTIDDEAAFVAAVLAGQPEPPRYFAQMKRINREGPAVLGGFVLPRRLSEHRLASLLEDGALVIDTRHAAEFGAEHVPATLNIPLDRSFTTWAGWLTPYDREFYLILDDDCAGCAVQAVRELAMIGLDRIGGYFGTGAIAAWAREGRPLETIDEVGVRGAAAALRSGSATVIDVRGRTEWEAGHLPGVANVPLGYLVDRAAEIPADRRVIVHCQSGGRSSIAASLLRAHGVRDVVNLNGGFAAWQAAGYPVEKGAVAAAAA